MKTVVELVNEGLRQRGAYQIASSLISREGDEAEKVIYLSGLHEAVRTRLLTAVRVRRVYLYNLRGF